MDTATIGFASALDLATHIRSRSVSPVEVVEALLSRIEAIDSRLNAFSAVLAESARAQAKRAEQTMSGIADLPPLFGVPIAVKEQMNVAGVRISFGTRLFANEIATEDAPVIARLRRAGAIVLGMTTMPEFGWQGHSWSPLFGMTLNPWSPKHSAGGSSAGSAAAIAAGLAPLALGSDGAGSIRIPASFCGVFGLKPTFGRIPMFPVSVSELVTHYGPITRTVRDAALMLDATVGPDSRDPFCLPETGDRFLEACDGDVRGLRIGYSADLGYAVVDPDVAELATSASRTFESLGCQVEAANPGFPDPIWSADQHLCAGSANRVWDRLPEWRDQMDPGFVAEVELLSQRTLFDSARARAERLAVTAKMAGFFDRYDLLLTPTMAHAAFGIDRSAREYQPGIGWSPFTYPFNLTGQPAATVPCGFTRQGLPVGLQIVGPRFADGLVLRACAAFESARPWDRTRPPNT